MIKSPPEPKSKVAKTKQRHILFTILITILVLILFSIWLQSYESEKTINTKPIVTASQIETRTTAPKVQENIIEEKKLTASPSVDILSSLQERMKQQNTRMQLADAQKRLIAPSKVYQIPENKNPTKNQLQQLFDANNQFANSVSNQPVATMSAKQQEITDFKIFQGKIIPGIIDTAVNSDLPGMVRATISEDVYGETGREVLLPRGTRLIGQYDSAIDTGQVRVYIIWTRAITPTQVDIKLASPGTDALGRGGLPGDVDNHFWDIFGTSLLLSTMAAGVAEIETNNDDNFYGNPYQYEVVESFTDNSNKILSKRLSIKPTINIDQGMPVRVMVAQDLDFSLLLP